MFRRILSLLEQYTLRLKKYLRVLFFPRYFHRLEFQLQQLAKQFEALQRVAYECKEQKFSSFQDNTRVRVVFLVQEVSLYSVFSSLIERLGKNPDFQVYVVLTPQYFCNVWQKEAYTQLEEYLVAKNISFVRGVQSLSEDGKIVDVLNLQTLDPHYIFYTCPFMEDYHPMHQCEHVHYFARICYIPYGFLLADKPKSQYNLPVHQIAYRIYCETSFHQKNYSQNRPEGSQVMVTGYTKFDAAKKITIPDNLAPIKKSYNHVIIIAPHWSIGKLARLTRFGTLDRHIDTIRILLKKFPDIYFIFKPHPGLKSAFKRAQELTKIEYDTLLKEWKSYENFHVYEGADYFEYFALSDGLITDSVSFLAEYLIFQKPLLLLKRLDHTPYNETGSKLITSFYHALTTQDVVEFISDVVCSKKDPMLEQRLQSYRLITPVKQMAATLIEEDLLKTRRPLSYHDK